MMKGSSYLGSAPKRALSRPRRFGSLAAVFLVFAVLLSSFATLPFLDSVFPSGGGDRDNSSAPVVSDASALWCSDPKEGNLGLGMDNRSDWKSGSAWYPHADTVGRVLTSQEAFGNGIQFTNFNGVGESPGLPWFWISPPVGLPETGEPDAEENLNSVVSYTDNTPEGEGTENWFKNMNSSRTPTKCVMGGIGASVANGVLGLTTGVTNLMGGISTFAFDPNFICDPDNASATNCIDLVGIIGGGGGSNEGIIGKLTSSVYFPLLALAALLVGVWIIWNGLAKRQFRETFLGVIWSLVVVILGIAMLLNPLMLAKAPMVVGNALTSCIVGAFTGSGGCANGSAGTPANEETPYCVASSSRTDFMDKAAITMTSMSCELWKAFVLQPYAQGSFGASLDQLDTDRSGTIAAQLVAKNPGFANDPSTFCVDTKVAGTGTLESRFGKTLNLTTDGSKICNLAIYQAYLGVDAKMDSGGGGAPAAVGAIDGRWLKVAQIAASDEGMYRAWAPSDWHLAQIGMALIGLISAVLAAVVVFVVAAFALAFYVTSILMIAFAPFFLLAGVHPGKGRKMMVGWIGQVLSNVMKYAASAIFLVITVALYGAVLSNVSNPGAILIFMIILTVALLMYRREIVDMIGVIDLGGEKLSNKFAERTMDRVKNTGKTAMAVGAGVTAGALSNGALNPFRVDNWTPKGMASNAKSMLSAGADSGRRSIKSRPGVIGEVMKASDRISSDNRADMAKQSKSATELSQKTTQELQDKDQNLKELNANLDSSGVEARAEHERLQEKRDAAIGVQFDRQASLDQLDGAQTTALSAVSNPAYREYQDLLNQMKNLEMKATIADASGLTEEAEGHRNNAQSIGQQLTDVQSRLSDEDYYDGQREYSTALANSLDDPRVTPDNVSGYENHVRGQYQATMATIGGTTARAAKLEAQQAATEEQLKASIVAAAEDRSEAAAANSRAISAAQTARDNVIDLKPGKVVRNTDVRKNAKQIDAIQNDRSDDIRKLSESVEDQMDERSQDLTEATDRRDAWREEVDRRRGDVAETKQASQRIGGIQQELLRSKNDVIERWREAGSSRPEDAAKSAYVSHLEASEAAENAAARAEQFSAKEAEEGGLSERDKSELYIARQEELTARAKMESSESAIRSSGSDLEAMKSRLGRAVEWRYSATRSPGGMKMENGLESFEQDLSIAADEVQAEMESRRAELQQAQANEAAAARDAKLAQRDGARLAETARNLRDTADSDKPVTPKVAAKIERRTKKTTRGIPRPQPQEVSQSTPPVDQQPAPQGERPLPQAAPAPVPVPPQAAEEPVQHPVAAPQAAPQQAPVQEPVRPQPAPQAAPQAAEIPVQQPVAAPQAAPQQAPAQEPVRPQPAPQAAPQAAEVPVQQPVAAPQAAPQQAPAQEPVRPQPAPQAAPATPLPVALQGPSQQEIENQLRRDSEARIREAEASAGREREQAESRLRTDRDEAAQRIQATTDAALRDIQSANEKNLREIESERSKLRSVIDEFSNDSKFHQPYLDILSGIDETIANSTKMSEAEFEKALNSSAMESRNYTDHVSGLNGGFVEPNREIQQRIEAQISQAISLRNNLAKESELSAQKTSNDALADILSDIDGIIANSTKMSDGELKKYLLGASQESEFYGDTSNQELQQRVKNQISRVSELRGVPSNPSTPKPTDNTPGADDGNPFRGGNPFKR